MDTIKSFAISEIYLIAILGIVFVIAIISFYNTIKINSLTKKYLNFMKGFENVDMEKGLEDFMLLAKEITEKNKELENHCNEIDRRLMKCIQKVGVVRYNAFEDTGSDLSFTIALLDEEDNGVAINGVYSRERSSIYAKPIRNGSSKYTLSTEEIEAIDIAKNINTKDKNISEK